MMACYLTDDIDFRLLNDFNTETGECDPLDRMSVEINKNGVKKLVPALHQGWAEKVSFIRYVPPPNLENDTTCNDDLQIMQESWIDRMTFIQENLTWLLELPHHRFWSQIVYDQNVRQFLDSFLTQGPRYYDPPNPFLTEEMKKILLNVFKDVFLIHLRMATYKESHSHHITPATFGEMIYENFLFDIPKLMDLAALYADSNSALLQKLIENIFKCQPKYYDDLLQVVPSILTALDNVQTNFGLRDKKGSVNFELNGDTSNHINETPLNKFQDTLNFLVDITATLSAFLDVYQPACVSFQDQNLTFKISSLYDVVVPFIYDKLKSGSDSEYSKRLATISKKKLHLIKNCCLKIFRSIIVGCYIHPIVELNDNFEKRTQLIDNFLEVMLTTLSETNFICDYANKYPLEDDLDIIAQTHTNFDSVRVDYLLRGIECLQTKSLKNKKKSVKNLLKKKSNNTAQVNYSKTNETAELFSEGACASAGVTGVELESLISQIKDLLPKLGEGFIEACLDYYNFIVEDVINVLLEDSLPPILQKLDRSLPRKERSENVTVNGNDAATFEDDDFARSILSERRNVFDNDEFDVFSRETIDTSRVHKKKRNDSKTAEQLLNDKSHIVETKHIYQGYQNIIEEVDDLDDLYNDEYDDTYDENTVGALNDDIKQDDLLARRPFTVPRVFDTEKKEKKTYQEDEDGTEENGEEKPRDCFVANPEDVRRWREQRWQAKQQNRPRNNTFVNRDVKGQSRGQGQSTDVLRNRGFKERNKSSRANHNRRQMADRKRSGGMIPS